LWSIGLILTFNYVQLNHYHTYFIAGKSIKATFGSYVFHIEEIAGPAFFFKKNENLSGRIVAALANSIPSRKLLEVDRVGRSALTKYFLKYQIDLKAVLTGR